jgi:SAM-dependent MidA family methyltransferase
MTPDAPPPERLDRFMARANAIYYASHDPFADFTTSPEISQVFGEIIGLWAAITWVTLGSPDPVLLVEAGPGRGTLMADALRAVRTAMPAFAAALRVHFIETSARLRAVQATRVPQATWHEGPETLPDGPMLLLANEFLDALPIRQFVRRGGGWAERYVAGEVWVERPVAAAVVPAGREAADGEIVEVNEAARAWVAALAHRVVQAPGVALLIDYGPMRSAAGDSLQAIADKRMVTPLSVPGSADLTAHVDFADLARVAEAAGAAVQGPVTQARFLAELGLFQRTEKLARQRADKAAMLHDAARRLVDPQAMGELFKVMAIASPGCGDLPGLSSVCRMDARAFR